jgi:hypothetical protein
MSESRTVPLSVITDRIKPADHAGVVCYVNNTTNIVVTLPASMPPMYCQVSATGTGTVTFVAEGAASLNGTVGGQMAISQNTPYWLSVHYNAKGVASWFLK